MRLSDHEGTRQFLQCVSRKVTAPGRPDHSLTIYILCPLLFALAGEQGSDAANDLVKLLK